MQESKTADKKRGLTRYVFFLVATTTGCSYFALPCLARTIGLLPVCALLILPLVASYYSSLILFEAYIATKARSYDDCVARLFGRRSGIAMNFVIFLHNYASLTQAIFFCTNFLFNALLKYLQFESSKQLFLFIVNFKRLCTLFGITIMFLHSIFGNPKSYKQFAFAGVAVMLGVLFTSAQQAQTLYVYHNSKFEFTNNARITPQTFAQAFGLINLLYVNACQIFPVCNNIPSIDRKKLRIVLLTATLSLYAFYQVFTVIGFLSLPYQIKKEYMLFTNRPVPPEFNDLAMWTFQLLLGYNLALMLFAKTHRYCATFKKFLSNAKYLFVTCVPPLEVSVSKAFLKSIQKLKKKQKKVELSVRGKIIAEEEGEFSSESEIDFTEDIENEERFQVLERSRIDRRISIFAMGIQDEEIEDFISDNTWNKVLINFLVLFGTAGVSIFFEEEFVSWLAILGFLLVILEVIIYPLAIIVKLNSNSQVYSMFRLRLLIWGGSVYGCFCFLCICKLIYHLIF